MGFQHADSEANQTHKFNAQQTTDLPRSGPGRQKRDIPVLRSSYFQFSIAGLAAVFLLATVGVAALGRQTHPEGTIPPGVHVAGASVGEMEIEEARATLEQHLADYTERPVTLTYDDQTWEPSMDELGASFDLTQTLDDAQFSESRLQRAETRLFGPDRTDVPLRIRIDNEKLETYVSGIASEVDRTPQVPELTFEGERLSLSPAQTGLEVEQESVSESIRSALYTLRHTDLDVSTTETQPEFDDADVDAVRAMVDESLDGPITIWFEDQSWAIQPDQLIEYLKLEQNEQGEIELGFHEDELYGYLDQLIGDINRPAQNAEIAWGGESVVATSPSQNGIERDLNAMIPRLEEAIANGQREVELTYDVISPSIDSNNLGELGIDGLMAQGESAFWNSSASRANNISVAAGYLDGTVVAPGQEFSFNQSIGEISLERGYEEGYVIQAEETVEGIGGGVCQVSTTMFRSAFFSGMPITERHPHAYVVGYYEEGGWPLGFDAAIFQPHSDFRFLNETDSYMLIHTHVVDQKLYVNIYGADTGYDVELGDAIIENETEPPEDVEVVDESLAPGERQQVEWAKPGMEVTVPRTVTNSAGEVVRQDSFYSNFQAWGNRFLVGPTPEAEAETQDPEDAPTPQDPDGEIIEEETNQGETEETNEAPASDENNETAEPESEVETE